MVLIILVIFNTYLVPISEYQNIISLGFTILISFTLIALYNIQNYIENPFDQKGFDDVKLKEFKLKEEEI